MQDATYLTELHKGRGKGEQHFWEPCLADFFRQWKPSLPVYRIEANEAEGRRFLRRDVRPLFHARGNFASQLHGSNLLGAIEDATKTELRNDPGRYAIPRMDDAGISVDLLHTDGAAVTLLEIKPYDKSSFSGNQLRGESYTRFICWLRSRGVDIQWLFLMPFAAMWDNTAQFSELQSELGAALGFIVFEDVFTEMSKRGYRYKGIERWSDYALKESKYFPATGTSSSNPS